MREIIPASVGAEADVPLTCSTLPSTTTTKLCPAAETSGKPLVKTERSWFDRLVALGR